MFKSNPFPCTVSSRNTLGIGNYPMFASQDKMFDLFKDVHSFKVRIYGEYFIDQLNQFIQNQGQANVGASDSALSAGALEQNSRKSYGEGFTNRIIGSSPFIPEEGEQGIPVQKSTAPTVCGEFPSFSFSSGGVSVNINMGRLLNLGGLYAPYVEIKLSNGMSNSGAGLILGSVSIVGFGAAPMYGTSAEFGICNGVIDIAERYSDLGFSTFTVSRSSSLFIGPKPGKTFTGFKDLKEVWLGPNKMAFSPSENGDSVTIQMNGNATSDYLTFVTELGNKFSLDDRLNVTA